MKQYIQLLAFVFFSFLLNYSILHAETDRLKNTLATVDSCDINITGNVSEVSCKGGNDGAIDITVLGSNLESYLWNNGQITEDISSISAGKYTVQVTGNNCLAEAEFIVAEPSESIQVKDTKITAPTCANKKDGVVEIIISGGSEPYTIMLEDKISIDRVDGLAAGLYNFKIADANNCMIELSVEVPAKEKQIIDLGPDASILSNEILKLDAGAGFDHYLWSTGEETQTLEYSIETDKTTTENISVEAFDINGCQTISTTKKITINPVETNNANDEEPEIEEPILDEL
jgi:hypothetical protein